MGVKEEPPNPWELTRVKRFKPQQDLVGPGPQISVEIGVLLTILDWLTSKWIADHWQYDRKATPKCWNVLPCLQENTAMLFRLDSDWNLDVFWIPNRTFFESAAFLKRKRGKQNWPMVRGHLKSAHRIGVFTTLESFPRDFWILSMIFLTVAEPNWLKASENSETHSGMPIKAT